LTVSNSRKGDSLLQKIAADLPPEKRTELPEVVRKRYEKLGLAAPEALEK